jgi:hypothetical protein
MTQNPEKVCHSAYRKSVGKMLHRQNARRQNEMSPKYPGFREAFKNRSYLYTVQSLKEQFHVYPAQHTKRGDKSGIQCDKYYII